MSYVDVSMLITILLEVGESINTVYLINKKLKQLDK